MLINCLPFMIRVFISIVAACWLTTSALASAEEIRIAEPSVQENIAAMDSDGDGLVTVLEVRAFIEGKHGKFYQTAVLDEMEASARGRSCSTPFAGAMYYIP
jgi:hypothetical protein